MKKIFDRLPLDFSQQFVRDISPLTCSVYGEVHARILKEKFSVNFTFTALIPSGNDLYAFYRSQNEHDVFARAIGEKFEADSSFMENCIRCLKEKTDWFFDFISKIETWDEFHVREKEFFNHYLEFFAYHEAVYYGGDFLARHRMNAKKKVSTLIKAHKYNELVVPKIEDYLKSLKIESYLYDEEKASNVPANAGINRAFLFKRNKRIILSKEEGLELRSFIQERQNEKEGDSNLIKGIGANKGRYSGKVNKITNLHCLGNCKPGDVLVTTMTRPQYNQSIKCAGAIVTDEGGILCHASILAREYKIPCIVGTKIATKVLKDGDMVEVDANKGIVRKI